MPEEKKCTKTEELCEGKIELSIEELESVVGGSVRAAAAEDVIETSVR